MLNDDGIFSSVAIEQNDSDDSVRRALLSAIIPGIFNRVLDFKAADGKTVRGLNYTLRSKSGIEKLGSTLTGLSDSFSTGKTAEPTTVYLSAD